MDVICIVNLAFTGLPFLGNNNAQDSRLNLVDPIITAACIPFTIICLALFSKNFDKKIMLLGYLIHLLSWFSLGYFRNNNFRYECLLAAAYSLIYPNFSNMIVRPESKWLVVLVKSIFLNFQSYLIQKLLAYDYQNISIMDFNISTIFQHPYVLFKYIPHVIISSDLTVIFKILYFIYMKFDSNEAFRNEYERIEITDIPSEIVRHKRLKIETIKHFILDVFTNTTTSSWHNGFKLESKKDIFMEKSKITSSVLSLIFIYLYNTTLIMYCMNSCYQNYIFYANIPYWKMAFTLLGLMWIKNNMLKFKFYKIFILICNSVALHSIVFTTSRSDSKMARLWELFIIEVLPDLIGTTFVYTYLNVEISSSMKKTVIISSSSTALFLFYVFNKIEQICRKNYFLLILYILGLVHPLIMASKTIMSFKTKNRKQVKKFSDVSIEWYKPISFPNSFETT